MSGEKHDAFPHADSTEGNSRYFVLIGLVLLMQLLIVAWNASTVNGHLNTLFTEDGLVEVQSPIGYGLCIVLIVALGGFRFAFTRAFSLVIVFFVMLLRELDFHTRFTTMSITKLNFFLSEEVPLHEKIFAFIALALIACAVLHVLITHGRSFLAGLKRLSPMSIAAVISMLMLALSEGMDGIGGTLGRLGFPIGLDATDTFEKVEETLELGISIFAALAILAYFSAKRIDAGPPR